MKPGEGKRATKGCAELVRCWLRKNKFTTASGVARVMMRLYPDKFPKFQRARGVVGYVIGRDGKHSRKYAASTLGEFGREVIALPEPLRETFFEPYECTSNRALILNDIHVPFQVNEAIETAVSYAKKQDGIDEVILNGDIWDCYEFSRFTKNALQRSLEYECNAVDMFLVWLRHQFPKQLITWKLGNHEARYVMRMNENNADLMRVWDKKFKNDDDKPHSLSHFFGLKKYGIRVLEQKKPIKFGKLTILHGDELGTGACDPVNPARTLYMKYKDVACCGHSHRPSSHTEKTGNDFVINTWSMGCLCELRPFYRPINGWLHGFAIVDRDDKKGFDFHNKKILKNGEVYEA